MNTGKQNKIKKSIVVFYVKLDLGKYDCSRYGVCNSDGKYAGSW